MNLITKCARFLALLIAGLWLAGPAFADDGDSAICATDECVLENDVLALLPRGAFADHSRPGSVMLFPKFIRGGGDAALCGAGNVSVDGVCLPRTEIELGATCPTLFLFVTQGPIPCPDDEAVTVRFRWVCPGVQDFEHKFICKTTGFDVHLTVNGKVVFTANGFRLPDTNQVHVPAAPCDRGYLIGWVIDDAGRPIKYDGLIGDAVIRNSGTAALAYRGIPIQAEASMNSGTPIQLVSDPLNSLRLGLPFDGQPGHYRLVTGQVTGDVTFDRLPSKRRGFGVSTSLILLTLDVRSDSPNFPTFVDLDFWNGSEKKLSPSPSVKFGCWGEFQLSDIDIRLTQAFMGTRKGVIQSSEAIKVPISGIPDVITDIRGRATLLGLIQTNEGPSADPAARSYAIEFFDNGIAVHYALTNFFP
jgi:hypothetical protein